MKRLGVNIDHVATLRNARGGLHPDPIIMAKLAMSFGADSITIHLREDRRHIRDIDLKKISKKKFPLNLEIGCNLKMMKIALKNKPNYICLVPEKRKEITTEGGLNLKKYYKKIKIIINKFNTNKISALSDISIYTYDEEILLSELFNRIQKKYKKEVAISHLESAEELKKVFEELVPNYDKEQVYNSDIKKVFQWYNILHDTDNLIKEESKEEEKKESSADADKKKEASKIEVKKSKE